jgi:GT2 family glycosyltransferase
MLQDAAVKQPLVSIIIVNFNGKRFLKKCFSSIISQTYPSLELILVDNGSKDGSVELVQKHFPGVKIITNGDNLGFAKGNNIGIRAASGDLIATLNNDTEASPYWVESLVSGMLSDDRIGMCASRMLFMRDPGMINSTGICISRSGACWDRGMFEQDHGQYARGEVFGPCAGAALYKKKMLDEIGLFDEDFFAYMEDADLAFRGRAAGGRCVYVPEAAVYHYHSATSGYMSDFSIYHGNRNIVWSAMKNFQGRLLWSALPWIVGRSLAVIPYYTLRGHGKAAILSKIDAIKGIPRMIARRQPYNVNAAEIARFISIWADIPAAKEPSSATLDDHRGYVASK